LEKRPIHEKGLGRRSAGCNRVVSGKCQDRDAFEEKEVPDAAFAYGKKPLPGARVKTTKRARRPPMPFRRFFGSESGRRFPAVET